MVTLTSQQTADHRTDDTVILPQHPAGKLIAKWQVEDGKLVCKWVTALNH